jgi:hypothetical protein
MALLYGRQRRDMEAGNAWSSSWLILPPIWPVRTPARIQHDFHKLTLANTRLHKGYGHGAVIHLRLRTGPRAEAFISSGLDRDYDVRCGTCSYEPDRRDWSAPTESMARRQLSLFVAIRAKRMRADALKRDWCATWLPTAAVRRPLDMSRKLPPSVELRVEVWANTGRGPGLPAGPPAFFGNNEDSTPAVHAAEAGPARAQRHPIGE